MKKLYRKFKNAVEYAMWSYIILMIAKLPVDIARDVLHQRKLSKQPS